MKDKHPGGKPLLFKTAGELQKRVDEFFEWVELKGKPPTIARLAIFLDCDRQTIYNYEKKDEYFDIIKKARNLCIADLEERTVMEGKPGQIFIAKNYGYTDKQEIVSTVQEKAPDLSGLSEDDLKKLLDK